MHRDVKAALIAELSMFRGGYHERPYDDPILTELQADGLVVWIEPDTVRQLVDGDVVDGWWSPTLAGLQLVGPRRVATLPAGTTCAWFALCGRPATGYTPHPVLGEVPTCDRCAAFAAGGGE